MSIFPELKKITEWLTKLNVEFEEVEGIPLIYLSYLEKIEGVYEAKIELIDNLLKITIISRVKLSAIMTLVGELSQINQTMIFAKVYLDANESSQNVVFTYSLHIAEGISFNQFSLSLSSFEEETLQFIDELYQCDLLSDNLGNNFKKSSPILTTFH